MKKGGYAENEMTLLCCFIVSEDSYHFLTVTPGSAKNQIDCSLYSCAKAAFLKQTEKCWQISMQIRFSLISFGSGSREAQLYATKPKRPCPAPCCMNGICCLFFVVVVFKHQGNSCMCLGCCTCGVATYFRHW